MQQAQKRVLAEIWERRNPDVPVKSPEQLVTLASIVEKETGKAGRAQPRRGGVRQSAAAEDEAAVRSDHHLWPGRRQGHAGPADQAQRNHAAVALQHLRDRGPAAGADRQSRPRLAGSRRQSGAHPRPVLRRRRHRRPRLHRNLRPAPEERRQTARDGKADPERHGRAGRRRAAAGRRAPAPPTTNPTATTQAGGAEKAPRTTRRPGRALAQSTATPPVVQR